MSISTVKGTGYNLIHLLKEDSPAMRGFVPPDPHGSVSTEHYAVVTTTRTTRTRFPAACVEIVADAQAAMAAGIVGKQFAARVLGPSKSSEGVYIYYLMEWL